MIFNNLVVLMYLNKASNDDSNFKLFSFGFGLLSPGIGLNYNYLFHLLFRVVLSSCFNIGLDYYLLQLNALVIKGGNLSLFF